MFRYMDKKLSLKLNGGRCVQGILRGFDPFMNVVLDESQELCKDGKKNEIGMVVSTCIPNKSQTGSSFSLSRLFLGHSWKQYHYG